MRYEPGQHMCRPNWYYAHKNTPAKEDSNELERTVEESE